jgi:hypothetical protein
MLVINDISCYPLIVVLLFIAPPWLQPGRCLRLMLVLADCLDIITTVIIPFCAIVIGVKYQFHIACSS